MSNDTPMRSDIQVQVEVGPADDKGRRLISITRGPRAWRDTIAVGRYSSCIDALRTAGRVLCVDDVDAFAEHTYQTILRMADEADVAALARARQVDEDVVDDEDLEVVDMKMVVRPELFFTPTVAGISVAPLTRRRSVANEDPTPRWFLYVHFYKEHRRKRYTLRRYLPLPDGGTLWFRPRPRPPSEPDLYTWSEDAQKAWLAGRQAPTAGQLFLQIRDFLSTYLVFPPDEQEVVPALLALYTMLTYTTPVWMSLPYIHIVGTQGSGKTRALELLELLVFRPHMTVDTTAAVVYRHLHLYGGTLLIDEADRLRRTNDNAVDDLIRVLNAGYRRGGTATRLQSLPQDFDPTRFQVYAPKVLAGINSAPPTLASRCITINMIRAETDAPQSRARVDHGRAAEIRDSLYMWALDYADIIYRLPNVDACPSDIGGRPYELWLPLLALASWVDEDLPNENVKESIHNLLSEFARSYTKRAAADLLPEGDEVLLKAIAELCQEQTVMAVADVLERARLLSPDRVKGWSARRVGEILRRYGIDSRDLHGRRVIDAWLVESKLPDIERRYNVAIRPTSTGVP